MGFRGIIAALSMALSVVGAWGQTVVVHPARIDDVLANPGMGIQTFQRFNGDPLNSGTAWSEEGPTGPPASVSGPPDFPPSTIAYCRWFWATLEPAKGDIRWGILDRALQEAARHGQTLAIRLMPYDQKHPLPEWYRQSGARRANPEGQPVWEPDFADPLYLKHWGALVHEAGRRYNGDPRLDAVDISSVGYWGEGWSDYMPPFEHQKKLIDIWFEAFPSTPLLMNFDQPEGLRYGTGKGAGWRFDCLGDLRQNWSHMLDFYPLQIVRAGVDDVWRRAPVSFETCWVPEYWKQHGWDANYILNEALRWHVSSLNIKSSAIPADWKRIFEEFQKRMGYRFELRRIEYPRQVRAGSDALFRMWWVNAGVAPVYRPYSLALSFHGARDGSAELPADIRKWLPGDTLVEENIAIPDLPPGQYRVRTALLDKRTGKPAIALAIAGKTPDGWYDLGEITVLAKETGR
ncbi:MAG: DUF4832 domain-containing protein [Acidobacteriia bacterium]|nr:DUF4832 domain-containing protein [Terriglobia bacterium]